MEDIVSDQNHPNQWFARAAGLRAGAACIWLSIRGSAEETRELLGEPVGFSMALAARPSYHLLCGLAIEVLLKAILVSRGKKPANTHDSVLLANEAGLATSQTDVELLKFYASTVVWAAKYPTSRKGETEMISYWENAGDVLTTSEPVPSSQWIRKIGSSGRTDWPSFAAMYSRIAALRQA